MSVNANKNLQNFPEDKDAPLINSGNRKYADILVFIVILFTTILTVSFSIYILIVKYIN